LKYLSLWGKEDNICQSIWDKNEVLWRTFLGNIFENLMRTHWEHEGNKE
jgi:hypothetical protein